MSTLIQFPIVWTATSTARRITSPSKTPARLLAIAIACLFVPAVHGQLGYINVPIQPGWNVIANQLSHGSNSLNEVLPLVPSGSMFIRWNADSQSYATSFFDPDSGGWEPPLSFALGEGGFLLNPSSPFVLSLVGEASWSNSPVNLPDGGLALVASPLPMSATYEDITGLPPVEGVKLYRYDTVLHGHPANLSNWQAYTFSMGTWTPGTPTVALGEPVFIQTPQLSGSSNRPPLLPPIPPLLVHFGEQFQQSVAAWDPDGGTLTYSLDPGWPAAQIDSTNGLLTFTSSMVSWPASNQIVVHVVDNGVPPLQSQQAIDLIVGPPIRIQSITQTNGDSTLVWNTLPGREYFVRISHSLVNPVWGYRGSLLASGEFSSWTESIDTETPGDGTFYAISTSCQSCNCDSVVVQSVRDNQDKKASIILKTNPVTSATVQAPTRVYAVIDCANGQGECSGSVNVTAEANYKIVDGSGTSLTNEYTIGNIPLEGGSLKLTGKCGNQEPDASSPDLNLGVTIDLSKHGSALKNRLFANPPTAFIHVEFTLTIKSECDGAAGPVQTVIVAVDGRTDNAGTGIIGHFDRESSDMDGDGKRGRNETGDTPAKRHENDLDSTK